MKDFADDLCHAEAVLCDAVRRIEQLAVKRGSRHDRDDLVIDLKSEAAKLGDTIGVYGLSRPRSPVTWPL